MAETLCIGPGSDQITGTRDGYRHELWNQDTTGSACMLLGPGALFDARWSNVQNYLARRGLGYDQTRRHQEIGRFEASYDVVYGPICTSGNSYLGVYGWTYDPATEDLVEYYVIENWCNWIPSMDAKAEKMGTMVDRGAAYDIIRVPRINAPSIRGNRDFMQYFSIRQDKRNRGLIDISHHFEHWERLGMKLGMLHEVSMVVEGYKNSGSARFTALEVRRTDKRPSR